MRLSGPIGRQDGVHVRRRRSGHATLALAVIASVDGDRHEATARQVCQTGQLLLFAPVGSVQHDDSRPPSRRRPRLHDERRHALLRIGRKRDSFLRQALVEIGEPAGGLSEGHAGPVDELQECRPLARTFARRHARRLGATRRLSRENA